MELKVKTVTGTGSFSAAESITWSWKKLGLAKYGHLLKQFESITWSWKIKPLEDFGHKLINHESITWSWKFFYDGDDDLWDGGFEESITWSWKYLSCLVATILSTRIHYMELKENPSGWVHVHGSHTRIHYMELKADNSHQPPHSQPPGPGIHYMELKVWRGYPIGSW